MPTRGNLSAWHPVFRNMIEAMKVKLVLFGTLRNLATHKQEISLSGDTRVKDLINLLVNKYGSEFEARISHREIWQIAINGHLHGFSAAMEIELKDGDEVAMLPLLFGG